MASIFGFFRSPRVIPSVEAADVPPAAPSPSAGSSGSSSMSTTPSPPQRPPPPPTTRKRQTTPPASGRTAAVVAQRWKALRRGEAETTRSRAAPSTTWMGRLDRLRLVKSESVEVKTEDADEEGGTAMAAAADAADATSIVVTGSDASTASGDGSAEDEEDGDEVEDGDEAEDEEDDDEDDGDDSGLYEPGGSATIYPHPGSPQRGRALAASFQGSTLDADADAAEEDGKGGEDANRLASEDDEDVEDSDADLDDEDDENDDEVDGDEVDENWDWLFEDEPPPLPSSEKPPDARGDNDDDSDDDDGGDWPVDEDERAAYEQGVAAVEGYAAWTADEKRLHRLLSLRGFHPLLPATWTRDFLGVPMYPSLFAPPPPPGGNKKGKETVVTNYGSQFRATKALRALFDLQARVSGLRQTGHNAGAASRRGAGIGAIVERELRRYIAWAAADAGLDRCGPLAAMPNIAAKQFVAGGAGDGRGGKTSKTSKTKKRSLARQVQDYFGDWVARYRAYYASLPEYEVAGSPSPSSRRLRPPRLLYGFVIVQHAVMLLVVDAAAAKVGKSHKKSGKSSSRRRHRRRHHLRPRCLADFNLSLGDRWLDASLNVAIPVHVARAAQLRCRAGLALPATRVDDVDEDA